MELKNFNDLEFKPHATFKNGDSYQAVLNFDNGYGVSVLIGSNFYSNGLDTYEIAILKDEDITYGTHITDDVLPYRTEEEVTEIMYMVQELI